MRMATVAAWCVIGIGVLASCGGKIACEADASALCTSSGGGSVDCTKTACPNDPPITSAQTAACKAEVAGSCGALYTAVYQCILPVIRCDASGKTDQSSIAGVTAKCTPLLERYQTCKTSSLFGDGGPPTVDAGFK